MEMEGSLSGALPNLPTFLLFSSSKSFLAYQLNSCHILFQLVWRTDKKLTCCVLCRIHSFLLDSTHSSSSFALLPRQE